MIRFAAPAYLIPLALALGFVLLLGVPERGYGRRRELASLLLRLLIVASLGLGLAGLALARPGDGLALVFLVDVSDSISPDARQQAEATVRRAIENMGPEDQAAVVLFGADALVERLMSAVRSLAPFRSTPNPGGSDLEEAIRLGLALYPPGSMRRMLLVSDGLQTGGDALAAAELAAQAGVQLAVLPLPAPQGAETRLVAAHLPERLHPGERFTLDLEITASTAGPAEVRVLAEGRLLYAGAHTLRRGAQRLSLPLAALDEATPGGFLRFTVQITPTEDGFYQNNELAAYTRVVAPPRVLVVAPAEGELLPAHSGNPPQPRPAEAAALISALGAAGYTLQQSLPAALPDNLLELAAYQAVILVDVPARQLSSHQLAALQAYVRDLGGGLIAVGGPTSFGAGGYFRTPLEETLPVDMQLKDPQRRPELALIFVIDHSGSMEEVSGGVNKLELAKEAVLRSIELLYPADRLGVVAFDESAAWVSPLASLADPQDVAARVGSLRPGGGTDILAGLQAAAAVLPADPAATRHIILLTDGGADPAGIPELVRQLYEEDNITLTTVGVGSDAAPYLQQLAELGGGRYHFAADPAAIPRIFTEETALVSRAYIVEEPFTPAQTASSPILSGLAGFPPLYGYVAAAPKDTASTILVTAQGDPLLAAWQYGLGRSVAFTSDASGRWAQAWLGWDGFSTFWAQALGYVAARSAPERLQVQVAYQGEGAAVQVQAVDENGAYLNGLELSLSLVGPDGAAQETPLQQTAPGQYAGEFTPAQPGAYVLRVSGGERTGAGGAGTGEPVTGDGAQQTLAATSGWVYAYSPEYSLSEGGEAVLANIARLGGGFTLGADLAPLLAHNLPAERAVRPIWPWLLALAALLLPLDIAVRRLALTRSDWERAWHKLRGWLALRPARTAPYNGPQSAPVAAFQKVKRKSAGSAPPPTVGPSFAGSTRPDIPPTAASPSRPEKTIPPKAPQDGMPGKTAESEQLSTTASLLAAKRRRNKK